MAPLPFRIGQPAKLAGLLGATPGELRPGRRRYRDRTLETWLGPLSLRMPKLRQGTYFAPFLEPRKIAEKALVTVIQKA